MISIDLKSLWAGQETEITNGIYEVINKIENYKIKRLDRDYSRNDFKALFFDICQVLEVWTGKTFVGQKKSKRLENTYQRFFSSLMSFLLFIKDNSKKMNSDEVMLSKQCLFKGVVYRYLGSCFSSNRKTVEPKYNEIYVSWSKNPENSYLESKLYGPITWLKCEISEPYNGIDLKCFGVSRGTEEEVVFPTIKECIKEIKVIK